MAKKHFNFRLEEELQQQFKEKAVREGETPTSLLTQWIENYCNDSNDNNVVTQQQPATTTSNDSIEERVQKLENENRLYADSLEELRDQLLELEKRLAIVSLNDSVTTTSDDSSDDSATTASHDSSNDSATTTSDDSSNDSATTEEKKCNDSSYNNATTGKVGRNDNSNDSATTEEEKCNDNSNDSATTEEEKCNDSDSVTTGEKNVSDEYLEKLRKQFLELLGIDEQEVMARSISFELGCGKKRVLNRLQGKPKKVLNELDKKILEEIEEYRQARLES